MDVRFRAHMFKRYENTMTEAVCPECDYKKHTTYSRDLRGCPKCGHDHMISVTEMETTPCVLCESEHCAVVDGQNYYVHKDSETKEVTHICEDCYIGLEDNEEAFSRIAELKDELEMLLRDDSDDIDEIEYLEGELQELEESLSYAG